tara:strand:- start:4095 stop:4247 length:153 start_codon:yes stop_codon:yes gene_type:complete
MNAVEFLFALAAVFGSTALWLVWTSFVYRIEKYSQEDNTDQFKNNEETIV